jgi:NAD-dependent deacetylase sirtuin 5
LIDRSSFSNSFKETDPKFIEFRELFSKARSVVVLTGAGVSAESGVPTFRGDGGLWRQFNVTVRFHFVLKTIHSI